MKKTRKPLTNKDGDVRELTREEFLELRPLKEVHPKLFKELVAFQKASEKGQIVTERRADGTVVMKKRGRPRSASPRVNKSFRLDAKLVAAMEASDRYTARVEKALRREFLGK